jgi:hypothetical protein
VSFLIDPPLLYATGRAYASISPPRGRRDTAVAAATMAIFYGVSVPLYLNRSWTQPIWRACRARSGRDWMLNSGVLRLDDVNPSPRVHATAAAIFATYPLWLALGIRAGRHNPPTMAPDPPAARP